LAFLVEAGLTDAGLATDSPEEATTGLDTGWGGCSGDTPGAGKGLAILGRNLRIEVGIELTNGTDSLTKLSEGDTRDNIWHNLSAAAGEMLRVWGVKVFPAATLAAASSKPSSFETAIAAKIGALISINFCCRAGLSVTAIFVSSIMSPLPM
jgi:hypothetical protein